MVVSILFVVNRHPCRVGVETTTFFNNYWDTSKNLEKEILNLENLLSGKSHEKLWSVPKKSPFPVPPNVLPLFTKENVGYQNFLQQVNATSQGGAHSGVSFIHVIGNPPMKGRRGISIVGVTGGEMVLNERFDTYELRSESLRFVKEIQKLSYGTFVIVIVHDDATRSFKGEAQSALFRLGATKGIKNLPYRSAYLLIGVKGMNPGGAYEKTDLNTVNYRHSVEVEN
ncbi:interleukin-like EMT inducer domain-containing protein [Kiritimatiellaeota bacterium B1221]|nr:interleukin-like EMT inducer domain-containing protein [Kiritimatiellaeota bacterium B1221]